MTTANHPKPYQSVLLGVGVGEQQGGGGSLRLGKKQRRQSFLQIFNTFCTEYFLQEMFTSVQPDAFILQLSQLILLAHKIPDIGMEFLINVIVVKTN